MLILKGQSPLKPKRQPSDKAGGVDNEFQSLLQLIKDILAGNNQKGGILLDKKQPIPQQNGGINSGQFDQEAFMEYYYELNDDDKLKEQIVKNFHDTYHEKIVEDIEKLKQMHRDIPSRTNTIGTQTRTTDRGIRL